jgi:hypothetical protein
MKVGLFRLKNFFFRKLWLVVVLRSTDARKD